LKVGVTIDTRQKTRLNLLLAFLSLLTDMMMSFWSFIEDMYEHTKTSGCTEADARLTRNEVGMTSAPDEHA
jgi:hypothetical protein